MPEPHDVKTQFKVFYKPEPHYEGTYNRDKLKAAGLHGTFETITDAKEAAEKCRAFFAEEKTIRNPQEPREKHQIDVKTHNNVIVWIDEYRDGVKYTPPEPEKKGKAA